MQTTSVSPGLDSATILSESELRLGRGDGVLFIVDSIFANDVITDGGLDEDLLSLLGYSTFLAKGRRIRFQQVEQAMTRAALEVGDLTAGGTVARRFRATSHKVATVIWPKSDSLLRVVQIGRVVPIGIEDRLLS